MTVTVKRHGETWEALTMSPNHVAYADCVGQATASLLCCRGSLRMAV